MRVAERRTAWYRPTAASRCASTFCRIVSIECWKPRSSNRSASSKTKWAQKENFHAAVVCAWSAMRPGVPTRSATPLRSRAFSALRFSPPIKVEVTSHGKGVVSVRTTSCVCRHNSRVGTSTMAKVPAARVTIAAPRLTSDCTIGTAYARVLPEPVGERTSKSPPPSKAGMECCCTGVSLAICMRSVRCRCR